MEQVLTPRKYPAIRVIVLVALLIPLFLIPDLHLAGRLLSAVMPLIFTGTFRVSRIVESRFQTQFYFAFIPFPVQKCKLATVGFIETVYGENRPGIWTFILFGPLQLILGWIFDFLIPDLGGPYEIWLVTAKGREIKAWQGHSQTNFETNLHLLQTQTNAELRTRSVAL